MYNKLFSKILDSSIWLEPTATRLVWLTLIAVMDESGFVQFASVANVAHRARVTLEEAEAAILCLEGPDRNSSDPDHEGKRIERFPGGWIVLNAEKYRELVTRAIIKEQTKNRVQRFRERRKRDCNAVLTPSEAITEARSEEEVPSSADADYEAFKNAYPSHRRVGGKTGRNAFKTATSHATLAVMLAALEQHKLSEQWQTPKLIPLMTTWLNQERWFQRLPGRQRQRAAPGPDYIHVPAKWLATCQHENPKCVSLMQHEARLKES